MEEFQCWYLKFFHDTLTSRVSKFIILLHWYFRTIACRSCMISNPFNVLYWQLFNILWLKADNAHHQALEIPNSCPKLYRSYWLRFLKSTYVTFWQIPLPKVKLLGRGFKLDEHNIGHVQSTLERSGSRNGSLTFHTCWNGSWIIKLLNM